MIEGVPVLAFLKSKGQKSRGSEMMLRHLVVFLLTAVLGSVASVQAQNTSLQGSASTPLVLPSNNVNLNPTGAPGARLINDFTLGGPGGAPLLGAPTGGTVPTLNFGPGGIGRLSPPSGSSGVSGIGRLGPPGSIPNLMVTPSLVGPPTLSPGGTIGPNSNPSSSLGGGQGGPLGTFNPPSINPTNPNSTNFQANPTGTAGLRNPSNNFRP